MSAVREQIGRNAALPHGVRVSGTRSVPPTPFAPPSATAAAGVLARTALSTPILFAFTLLLAIVLAFASAPQAFADPTSESDAATAANAAGQAAAEAGEAAAEASEHITGVAANTAASTISSAEVDSDDEAALTSVADNPTNVVNPRQTPDNSFLYDTSIDELVMADSSFQGNTVQVTGEVVGDVLLAEEDAGKHWITLETLDDDSDSSISVLIDDSYLDMIDSYGEYGRTGTVLQVRGLFYLTCPSHEGIMDIHAESVKLVDKGAVYDQPIDEGVLVVGVLLVIIGLGLTVAYSRLRERQM